MPNYTRYDNVGTTNEKFVYLVMGEKTEKQCFNVVTHVVFDLDGLLLGRHIILYLARYNPLLVNVDFFQVGTFAACQSGLA